MVPLMFMTVCVPVNDLPGVGEVSNNLHGDEDLFFDIDGADHVVQKLPGVSQELAHLKVGFQLMEFLHLQTRRQTFQGSHQFGKCPTLSF